MTLTYNLTPINTVLIPSFQEWTDVYGMIQINPNQVTNDNGNLFTAHYVLGLVSKGLITDAERDRIIQVYKNNFLQPGLLTRWPNCNEREAQDDNFGLMGAEALLYPNRKDRLLTKQIYDYGRANNTHGVDTTDTGYLTQNKWLYWPLKILGLGRIKYCYNTVQPGKFDVQSWLGRFVQLTATMQMSQGKLVNPIHWIWWAISMLWVYYKPPGKSNIDMYTLNTHSVNACQGYGPLTNWVCNKVRQAVKRDFGDFAGVMDAYVQNVPNPFHDLLTGVL